MLAHVEHKIAVATRAAWAICELLDINPEGLEPQYVALLAAFVTVNGGEKP